MVFQIGYITHYDLDGITTVAELKIHEQNGKNESSVSYTKHSDLPSHLLTINPEIDKLYITDLVVPGTINISEELYRIANENPKKYRRDKITIITDKEVHPNIKKIPGVYVYSAEWKQNRNQSTSQMAYNYIKQTKKQEPDNICASLAILGAAGDGLLPESIFYNDTIKEAILLNNAIMQNKNNPSFLDEIVLELTKYGSIEDVNLKKRIKTDSDIFQTRINNAYNVIEKGVVCNVEKYFVSEIDNGKFPFGIACSNIRNKEGKNVIVIIKNNGKNPNDIIMRGYEEHSLNPLLDTLEEYDLYGGGHPDSNKPTGHYEIPKDSTDKIIKEITDFCSNPHNPQDS